MSPVDCYHGVVHPWMCDMMGHFTTRYYVAMFDDAAYHLLAAIGLTSKQIKAGIGIADLKTTLSYKAELHAGDLVAITGRVIRIGDKSITAAYEMKNVYTGVLAAEMEAISVQFDLNARRAISVIPEIREAAMRLMSE